MTKREFKVVSAFKGKEVNIPARGTALSAGYDIESAESIYIPSIFEQYAEKETSGATRLKPTMIPTGLKVYLENDEYLKMVPRSSLFKNTGLILSNLVGVIDADYVDNPDNEGHIMIPVLNLGFEGITIKKGERLVQGIFTPYRITNNDEATSDRTGGFGSTGK